MAQSQTSFAFTGNNSSTAPSAASALPVKLVIYDFDQTITSLHLYNELKHRQEEELKKMSDDRLLEIFGGSDRIQRLREHFKRVTTECEVAIISFGWVNVIVDSLKRMKLYQYFEGAHIIGRDSEELKTASAEKKECLCRMKKERKLKSDQIIFIDDSNHNISKTQSYCRAILVDPAEGMSEDHMKEIEEKCNVYPSLVEVSTPKTVEEEISKHYPKNSAESKENENPLAKYQIQEVPQWFDKLTNPETETPVIQVGGDQTPGSDSEYELNVPMLNSELDEIVKKPKNGLALRLGSEDEEEPQDEDEDAVDAVSKEDGTVLSLDSEHIANED